MNQNPQIYVVSLERAQERRKSMVRQACDHGLAIQFIDAIDASVPGALESHSGCRTAPAGIGRAEWACALSHHKAFREFLATGDSFCVILEDDVQISQEFPALLPVLGAIFEPRDAARTIAHLCQVQADESEQLILGRRTAIALNEATKARRIAAFRGNLWGTPGYAINRAAAQSLLKRAPDRADAWQWFINEGFLDEIWLVRPSPIEHDYSFPSDIEASRQSLREGSGHPSGARISNLLQRCAKRVRRILQKLVDPIISIAN